MRLASLPRGLLALIGAQNFGEAPKEMGNQVVPTIDVTKLYLLNEHRQTFGSTATPTNGYNSLITVPAGEVWNIRAMAALMSNGVGVTGAVVPAVRANNATTAMATSLAVAASSSRYVGLPCDLWMPSGADLGVLCSDIAGGNPTVALNIVYTPYRA